MKKICTVDIESSGLLADMLDYSSFPYKLNSEAKLWCVVVRDLETNEVFVAENEKITKKWMEETLLGYKMIILHNGLKFDLPVLMLFGVLEYRIGYLEETDTIFGKPTRFIDSLILSRIANPDRLGGHGLEAWGQRIGNHKTDFRGKCIEAGLIERNSPRGEEFKQFTPIMTEYCIQDTSTTASTYLELTKELSDYDGWKQGIKLEHKLADLAVRRETLGFWFDKELAVRCLEDLTNKMDELTLKVNPNLPFKKLTKSQEAEYTPPKNQIKADGQYTKAMENFVERIGAEIVDNELLFEGKKYSIPLECNPLRSEVQSTISDMDTVKMHLIDLGWNPTEWRERDLTKDSKKQNLTYEKRIKALDRWWRETAEGKYKRDRINATGYKEAQVYDKLKTKLKDNKPVRVFTSPSIRVGVEKELCPHLIELGDKVSFAKDFADYLTYRHRKSCIAGGDIEDMDFDSEVPNTGFLAMYREQDGRIPTPAIEIGAATFRYRHIGVANIPRASSVYGKEMRSMFGCGEGNVQLGFDFSSLENRVQGHYVFNGTEGELLAERLVADKPNDLHTINSLKLNISRTDAKSFTYAILYGASSKKVAKMLKITLEEADKLVNGFWEAVPALNELKLEKEREWLQTGKKYIRAIDGRKINIRSQHSILNFLFQSGGVIFAKYTNVLLSQKLEQLGYCIDCFRGKPDVAEMCSYHDEQCQLVHNDIVKYKTFDSEEEGKEFVKNWTGSQLSDLNFAKKWYVSLPNPVSDAIIESVKEVGDLLNMNVPLGIGWAVGKNWYQTH